jgi:uncharacterized integral membrane protein (TIGR00697 family)
MNDKAQTGENTPPDDVPRKEAAFLILAGIFLVSLVVANLITAKLFVLFGVTLAAGIIPYPVTFLATDLICEVYGQKRANLLVFVGFLLSLYVLLILKLGQHVEPFEPANVQREYEVIFGQSARAIFASMVAYLVAQLVDVRLFHFWKRKTKGKHLWLRNNASTMFSQLVDTILVISILFWGQLPTSTLIEIMVASYLFKISIAAVDTPFFYFGTAWLKRWLGMAPVADTRHKTGELLLAITCLSNIVLFVIGGAFFSGQWSSASQGEGMLILGYAVASHVTCTILLARLDLAPIMTVILAGLGAGVCLIAILMLSGTIMTTTIGCGALMLLTSIGSTRTCFP